MAEDTEPQEVHGSEKGDAIADNAEKGGAEVTNKDATQHPEEAAKELQGEDNG